MVMMVTISNISWIYAVRDMYGFLKSFLGKVFNFSEGEEIINTQSYSLILQ